MSYEELRNAFVEAWKCEPQDATKLLAPMHLKDYSRKVNNLCPANRKLLYALL